MTLVDRQCPKECSDTEIERSRHLKVAIRSGRSIFDTVRMHKADDSFANAVNRETSK